jgi:hypothetical protein
VRLLPAKKSITVLVAITRKDVSEGPYEGVVVSVIVAAAGGGVTDLKTSLGMMSGDMKNAFAKAGAIAESFRPAGAKT